MQSDETFTIAADCTTEGRTSTKAKRVQLLNAAVAPHSYKSYSRSELKNNQIVSHFRSNLLEENRHLKERLALLQPTNEYNVPKLACTTLRPTLLPETELYDLRHCAEFVSRYVDFETVSTPSNEYTVVSPTQTIAWARGDCFDVSFLLASLLLGNGHLCNVNDKNYWVNVDDDASIVKESAHDLTNSDRWRQVFPTDSEAPYSWVDKLKIPRDQFLLQYPPNGRRCILLDQAKVELFGDNVDPQGVVARIIQYEDSARTNVLECTELFSSKRNDHLLRRTRKPMFMMHHEFFSPMNEFSISERKDTAGVQRSINFYQKTRVDGLLKRVEDVGNSITEIFHARSDGLVRRIVYIKELTKDEKKPKHSEVITLGIGNGVAVLTRIDEHFEKPNDETSMEEAVAVRSFRLEEKKIVVTSQSDHQALDRHVIHLKEDIVRPDSQFNELIALENSSIRAVKKIQDELVEMCESNYRQETKPSSAPSVEH
eukprot:g4271.t1 g4271   contig15:683531-685342(+)